jgi:hypothetical protein
MCMTHIPPMHDVIFILGSNQFNHTLAPLFSQERDEWVLMHIAHAGNNVRRSTLLDDVAMTATGNGSVGPTSETPAVNPGAGGIQVDGDMVYLTYGGEEKVCVVRW